MRTLMSLARPHRAILAVSALLALVGSAAGLAQPLAARSVIDALGAAGGSLLDPLLLLGALVVVSALVNGLNSWVLGRTGERVVLAVRRTLAWRLVRLTVPELDGRPPGDLISRATADTTLLRAATTTALVGLMNGSVGLVGALVLMGVLDLRLFAVTAVVLVVVAVVVLLILPRIRRATEKAQASVGLVGSALDRALGAVRTVKASRAEARETAAVDATSDQAYRAGLTGARWGAVLTVVVELSLQVSFLVVLGVGGAFVADGSMGVSTLVAFLLYLFFLPGPLSELVSAAAALQPGLAAASRVEEITALPVEPDVDGPAPARRAAPSLSLRGVHFAYAGRDPVLHGVDLEVAAGSRVALVGPSGAGKSTVFSLLMRFHEPDSGTIRLDGRDLSSISRAELRHRVRYVQQDAPALAGTLGENLRLAAPDATDDEVRDVLRAARLDELVSHLPDGQDTQVGPRGVTLSGGERQRLAIARALLARPELLLLDEATSQLDARNEAALRDTVALASERCTALVIAHRLSTVVDADLIVVLDAGVVRAAGTHDELLAGDALYRELAATQLVEAGGLR